MVCAIEHYSKPYIRHQWFVDLFGNFVFKQSYSSGGWQRHIIEGQVTTQVEEDQCTDQIAAETGGHGTRRIVLGKRT
jgi:hypothetical protein